MEPLRAKLERELTQIVNPRPRSKAKARKKPAKTTAVVPEGSDETVAANGAKTGVAGEAPQARHDRHQRRDRDPGPRAGAHAR